MTALERLTDAVDELVQPRTHREPYSRLSGTTWVHDRHVTRVASLLDQLELAVEPSGSTLAGHRVPGSSPAARMDAINALLVIDTEVSQQVLLYIGEDRGGIADNLRAIVGLAAELGDPDQRDLARYARRWRTMAAIVTGWEVPARTLHNTCPLCGARGSLRVRVDLDGGSATGLCVECHETWDETTIGLLAEHMRVENGEQDGADDVVRLTHRPSVTADTKQMLWRAACACGWRCVAPWKAVALRAAEEHHEGSREEQAS